jgi:hypothetical protein
MDKSQEPCLSKRSALYPLFLTSTSFSGLHELLLEYLTVSAVSCWNICLAFG